MTECNHEWIPYLNIPNAVMCKSCGARGTVTIDTSRQPSHLERARDDYNEATKMTRTAPGYLARLEGAIGHIISDLEGQDISSIGRATAWKTTTISPTAPQCEERSLLCSPQSATTISGGPTIVTNVRSRSAAMTNDALLDASCNPNKGQSRVSDPEGATPSAPLATTLSYQRGGAGGISWAILMHDGEVFATEPISDDLCDALLARSRLDAAAPALLAACQSVVRHLAIEVPLGNSTIGQCLDAIYAATGEDMTDDDFLDVAAQKMADHG